MALDSESRSHAKVVQSDDLHLKQVGILSTVYSGQPVGGLIKQYLLIFAIHSFWATDGEPVGVCAILLASVSLKLMYCSHIVDVC